MTGMMTKKSDRTAGVKLVLISAFIYIALGAFSPFISAYYTSRGLSAAKIGILLAIGPVGSVLIQPLWANLSDRTGKRRTIYLLVAAGACLMELTYYLAGSFTGFFTATVLAQCFITALIPLGDAIIIDQAHKHHLEFSRMRLGGTLGWTAFVILFGRIEKWMPSSIFALTAAGYLLLAATTLTLPADVNEAPIHKMPQKQEKKTTLAGISPSGVYTDSDWILILLIAFTCQMGLQFMTSFFGVYVVKIGYAQTQLGYLNALSAFSEVPVLILVSRFVKKYGLMPMLFFACFMIPVRALLLTTGQLPFFYLSQATQGITYMTVHYCTSMWVYDHVAAGKLSEGQSILGAVQYGLGCITGSVVGGFLVDAVGLRSAFTTDAVLVFCVTTVLLLVWRCRQSAGRRRKTA